MARRGYGCVTVFSHAVSFAGDDGAGWILCPAQPSDAVSTARYEAQLAELLIGNMTEPLLRTALAVLENQGAPLALSTNLVERDLSRALSIQGQTDEAEKLKAHLQAEPRKREQPDVMPQIISKSEPECSERAKKFPISGAVILSFDVHESGRTQNIRIVWSLGEGLDENAVKAVKGWVFRPATKNGSPVSQYANVEVSFRIL